jgi:hypothetical protein
MTEPRGTNTDEMRTYVLYKSKWETAWYPSSKKTAVAEACKDAVLQQHAKNRLKDGAKALEYSYIVELEQIAAGEYTASLKPHRAGRMYGLTRYTIVNLEREEK